MKALTWFFAEKLKRLSPGAILGFGLTYIVALAIMDYQMPLGTSFTLFYLGGIALVAWTAGRWQGLVVAVVASTAIFAMEWALLRPGVRTGAILWNYASRIVIFAAIAWLTAEVSRLTRRLACLVEERTAQWKAEAEALHVSRRQLADAMDLARLANWEYDVAAARFTFDNRFYGLYATTAEREGGNQMSAEAYAREFLYPEDAHLVSEGIAQALATTDPNFTQQFEHRIRRRDGATRHLVVQVAVTKNAAGQTVKTRGVNQDITERKLVEEALRQSEERNRAIVATAMDGFALVDEGGRLLDVNAAQCQMSGYTREEMLRMSIPELEIAESPAEIAQRINSLKEAGGRFESRHRRKDGQEIMVEVSVSPAAALANLFCCFTRDITERKQAEAALRERDELNRTILATAMDGFYVLDFARDPQGLITNVNDAFCQMTGYGRAELLQMRIADLEAKETSGDIATHERRIRATGADRFETRHRKKDGREIEVEISLSRLTGRGRQVFGFVRDITERKEAEEALRASEERYRAVVEDQTEIISRFKADGTFTFVNEVFCRFFGKTSRELLGTAWQPVAMPEDIPRVEQQLGALSPQNPVVVVESQICSGLGEVHWMQFVNRGYFDPEGRLLEIQSVGRDITHRKQAEQRLWEAMELNRTLIAASTVGIAAFKASGECVLANEALHRITGGSLLHKNFHDLPSWRLQDLLQRADQVLATRQPCQLEFQGTTFFGKEIFVTVHFTPFVTNAELHLLMLVSDITEQKRAEEALKQDITDRKRAEENLKTAQRLQKAILDNIPDPAWLKDAQGHFLACNEPLARFYEKKPEEILGQTAFDLGLPEADRLTREDQETLASAKPLCVEEPYTDPQGQVHWFDTVKSPLFNHRGEVTGIVGISRETTRRRQMEEALRESEERYRSLVNNLNVGIYRNTPEPHGRFIQVNPALARMHCYDSPEELQKVPVSNLYQDPGDREAFLAELLRHGSVLNYELRLKRKSGGPIFASITATAHRNSHGEMDWIDGVIEDITERKRAEFLLRAQRDLGIRLSFISDLSTALNYLLEVAVELEGIDCGGAYLLDPAAGSLHLAAHRGVSSAFVVSVSHMSPDTPQTRLLQQGQPVFLPFSRLPSRPGQPKNKEGLRATAILPLQYEGKLVGALTLASHTQEEIPARTQVVLEAIAAQAAGAIARLRAEDALRQSEARLRAIITTAPVLLFAVDRHGIIRFEDGQALKAAGFQPGSTVGRSVQDVYSHVPAILENSRRALQGEEFSSVLEIDSVFLDCYYTPTRDKEGQVTGYIGVATNITERQRLQRQILEISDREQARIGQDIHDGLCQQLVSLAFDANSLKRQLSAKKNRAETATARRIADLLDAAITEARQLARGLFPIRLENDGLPSALEELARTTRQRYGVPCRFLSDAPAAVKSNAMAIHLYRIAQEAVTNAVKHARPRRITIRLLIHDRHLELKVEDNGTGAPASSAENHGMGLHIMEYRARSIGGTLHLAPGPRGGTTVSCCVPWPRS